MEEAHQSQSPFKPFTMEVSTSNGQIQQKYLLYHSRVFSVLILSVRSTYYVSSFAPDYLCIIYLFPLQFEPGLTGFAVGGLTGSTMPGTWSGTLFKICSTVRKVPNIFSYYSFLLSDMYVQLYLEIRCLIIIINPMFEKEA